jgi:hypothetical protein
VYREFHRKKLSKRLLNSGNVDNMEETFLQRLKSQWGAQFTQKMEGMCSDLSTARVKQQEFSDWLRGQVSLEQKSRNDCMINSII